MPLGSAKKRGGARVSTKSFWSERVVNSPVNSMVFLLMTSPSLGILNSIQILRSRSVGGGDGFPGTRKSTIALGD